MTKKKRILLLILPALIQSVGNAAEVLPTYTYEGSRFDETWQKVSRTPYAPENRPTRELRDLVNEIVERGLAPTGKTPEARVARNAEMAKRANQTLNDRTDYYAENFTKLVHANGICLKGSWNMTEANPYSGYFEQGKTGLMIARASVAMFDTNKEQNRAFGLAGKIYPVSDAISAGGTNLKATNLKATNLKTTNLKTANFFTVHDLGGERDVLFTEVAFTNQPPTTFSFTMLGFLGYAMQVAKTFKAADAENGNPEPDPGVRQLYEIAELGLNEEEVEHAITPRCIRIKARPGQRNDQSDFRDELDLADYADGKLILDVYADSPDPNTPCGEVAEEAWSGKQVGYIEFTESAASSNCDSRLHFHHPKWKDPRHSL